MDEKLVDSKDLVHLARLAMKGQHDDIEIFLRRLANRYKLLFPELSDQLVDLVRHSDKNKSVLRDNRVDVLPVDIDSRLKLARQEYPIVLPVEPIYPSAVTRQLNQIVQERKRSSMLKNAGLLPCRSALFVGPPGVGKTLAAKWLARELDKPLLTLDLSAVMSSFLGKTGTNVRNLLDYARSHECVLLLDEFDAIAKRRDDQTELGELKRLVTVLLQEIDAWPANGLLIAATNHAELLDPAIWRRFDLLIDFPMPQLDQTVGLVKRLIGDKLSDVVATALVGLSYSDIERSLSRIRRESILADEDINDKLKWFVNEHMDKLDHKTRLQSAQHLIDLGLSQREAQQWTGVSRDTIRKNNKGVHSHG